MKLSTLRVIYLIAKRKYELCSLYHPKIDNNFKNYFISYIEDYQTESYYSTVIFKYMVDLIVSLKATPRIDMLESDVSFAINNLRSALEVESIKGVGIGPIPFDLGLESGKVEKGLKKDQATDQAKNLTYKEEN